MPTHRWRPRPSRSPVTTATRSRRTSRAPTTPGPHPGRRRDPPHAGLRPVDQGDRAHVRGRTATTRSARTCTTATRPAPRRPTRPAAAIEAGGVPDDQCIGDVQRRGRLPARAPDVERQGRRDRLLLGRPPGVRRRVQPRRRRRGRLLRRTRRRHARRPHARAPDLADRPHARPALPAARPVRRGGRQPVARADRDRSKHALRANGKTYEFHTFENAGHAFFSVDRPNYRVDASRGGLEARSGTSSAATCAA